MSELVLEEIHVLKIFSPRGHDEIEWKEGDDASLKRAKKAFDDKLAAGWQAFKEVGRGAKKAWQSITAWDPKVARILLVPLHTAVGG